jgi:hypothetical protein
MIGRRKGYKNQRQKVASFIRNYRLTILIGIFVSDGRSKIANCSDATHWGIIALARQPTF